MQFEPTIILTRLVVLRGKHVAYDEPFHAGVNVIRGENSSGKSTVLNFIFYGLGGDLADWSEVALLCTTVYVEVLLNGHAATLRREVSAQAGQPMEIFGGPYSDAIQSPRDAWVRYPYRRSATLESFSQAIFRLLGLPEVAGEETGSLTIHQILRLLYADQLSPVESILRFERFDPPVLREAVGRLLCGANDATIYENELLIRELNKQFDVISGELRSLFAVLGRTDQTSDLDWISARRAALENEREKLTGDIESGEQRLFGVAGADELTRDAQQRLYRQVQGIQADLAARERERDALNLAIADSAAFIAGLESKLAALDDASLVAQYIGDVRFDACPACYAPMTPGDASEHACHLCKTPFDTDRLKGRIVSMVNDAGTQLKQSRLLQQRRGHELERLQSKIAELQGGWEKASRELAALERLPSTELQSELRVLNRQAGYVDRQLEDIASQEQIVALIREMTDKKDGLNTRITKLRSSIEGARSLQKNRLSKAYTAISEEVKDLLRNDLRRQDSFENPDRVEFDFSANHISVDGHTYFSASSRAILKSCFFLGFFSAATSSREFRHPRFLMLDTIEDKGMEPERSHNFQNQILRKSQEAVAEHQVIYATAMISPHLDDEEFVVGRFSTRDQPTLAVDT